MKKKLISILLSVIMIVGVIPFSAVPVFAENAPENQNKYIIRSRDSTKNQVCEDDLIILPEGSDGLTQPQGMSYVRLTETAEQPLVTPTADDFTFTPPEDCVHDGQPKQASVFSDKTGMGNITVKYQKNNGSGWDSAAADIPTEIGKYRVVISVSEGTNYSASASDIISDSWTFEITCQHNYIDYICEYCGDERYEDAKTDAIKAIHEATERSEDTIVKLLAETAEAILHDARSVAVVLQTRDYWLTAINKQLGGIPHEHTFSTEYSKNETVHWYAATCGHDVVTGLSEHTFGEGVTEGGKTTYTCTVCGYEKVETEDETAKLLEDALAAMADLENLLEEKQAELDKLNEESDKNDKKITALNEEIDSLNSQLEAAQKEIERLKGQCGDPSTGEVCSKCGKVHSNDIFGQIKCFINRILNFFNNLLK